VDHERKVIGDRRQPLVIVGAEVGHPTMLADAGAPADAVGPLQGRVMNAAKGGDARPVADLQGVQAGYVGWRFLLRAGSNCYGPVKGWGYAHWRLQVGGRAGTITAPASALWLP